MTLQDFKHKWEGANIEVLTSSIIEEIIKDLSTHIIQKDIERLKKMIIPFKASENMELRDAYNKDIQTIIDIKRKELEELNEHDT